MIRKPTTLAALVLPVFAMACTDVDQEFSSTDRQVCTQISRLAQEAKRDSFSLDYSAAERGFRRVIALYNEGDAAERCNISFSPAQAHMNLGMVLSNQRHYRLAEGAFKTAAGLLQGKTDEASVGELALLGVFRSHHSLNKNVAADAERHANQTLTLLDQYKSSDIAAVADNRLFAINEGVQNRRIAEAQSLYALGFVDLSGKRYDIAEARSAQGLNVVKTLPTTGLGARFMIQQALAQAARKNWGAAAATANEAALELEDKLPNSPLLGRALLVEAAALSAMNNTERAADTFERAFEIYEETPVGLRYQVVWPFIRFAEQQAKRGAMTERDKGAQIFRAGQLIRSSFTAYDIAAAAALFEAGDGDDAAAVRNWRAAEERLARLRAAQGQRARLLPEQVAELDRLVSEAADEEARLREIRDEEAPAYARALNAPVGLDTVQAALKPGELMVQILTGDSSSTVLLISPDDVKVRVAKIKNEQLRQVILTMRQSFIAREGQYAPFAVELSYVLQQALFGEFMDTIRAAEHAFVSTNGVLQGIPLELLVVDNPQPLSGSWGQGDYRGLSWLGDDVVISYLPSPRNLVDIRERAGQSEASQRLIAFGDFEPSVNESEVLLRANLPIECAPEARAVANLKRLPGAEAEINRITRAMGAGAEQVTKANFTEEDVLGRAERGELADYQIVHFATHGLLWQSEDCFTEPSLVTSVGPGSTADGLLTSSEIRQMKLDAQFVVLSACDTAGTGTGLGISGESLSGLARAFFSGGSRSVIASHWVIEDNTAVDVMGLAYESMGRGETNEFGKALQAARTSVRGDVQRSHPAFWAPFVVIGDGTLGLTAGSPT